MGGRGTFPEGNTSLPRLDPSQWWKYNGSAIDYIFVSGAVRARTWETVVPPGILNGFAKNPPSDHDMIMTGPTCEAALTGRGRQPGVRPG